VKTEISESQTNDAGKDLASTFMKDPKGIKGESKQEFREVIEAQQADATDEVDQERITRGAQKAVKDYFGSMAEDAK